MDFSSRCCAWGLLLGRSWWWWCCTGMLRVPEQWLLSSTAADINCWISVMSWVLFQRRAWVTGITWCLSWALVRFFGSEIQIAFPLSNVSMILWRTSCRSAGCSWKAARDMFWGQSSLVFARGSCSLERVTHSDCLLTTPEEKFLEGMFWVITVVQDFSYYFENFCCLLFSYN